VAEAQHRGRRTIILRHGKPSAAIVPVDVALAGSTGVRRRARRGLSPGKVRAIFGRFKKSRTRHSAVADLLGSRR
jgi:hypothetical protein